MRKVSKYCKLIPLMIVLVLSLCGCVSLKDLKDSQAFWKDNKKETIVWQGKEYHYLTDTTVSHFNLEYDYGNFIYITEEEVPVLLAEFISDYGDVSKDKQFINSWEKIYCIEDKYEEMKAFINNPPEMDCYAYRFYDNDDAGTDRFCIVDDEQEEQLKEIIKESKNEKDYFQEDYNWVTEIFVCSKDGMFREYQGRDLCKTVDGELFWEVTTANSYAAYEIPKKYYKVIEEIFAEPLRVNQENLDLYEEE